MSESRTSERKEGKRERIGFGGHRTRLQLSDDDLGRMDKEGYRPHWFNDEYGAIQRAEAAGYVFVKPEEARSVGGGEIHQDNSDLSRDRVSKIVSRGNPPVRAYLMKIKREYYQEDRESNEEVNRQVDQALRQGNAGGADIENKYGDVSQTQF